MAATSLFAALTAMWQDQCHLLITVSLPLQVWGQPEWSVIYHEPRCLSVASLANHINRAAEIEIKTKSHCQRYKSWKAPVSGLDGAVSSGDALQPHQTHHARNIQEPCWAPRSSRCNNVYPTCRQNVSYSSRWDHAAHCVSVWERHVRNKKK